MCVDSDKPQLVAAAVASIHAQSLREFELIVVATNVESEIREAVECHADERFTLLECGGGRAAQLNHAIARARADFVAFMSPDSVATPERLAIQQRYLVEHGKVVVVGSDLDIVDDGDRVVGYRHYPSDPADVGRRLRWGNVISFPSVMTRKSALRAIGGFDEGVSAAPDYDLWSRLAKEGHELANVPTPLTRVRVRAATDAALLRATLRATIEVKRRHFAGELGLFDRGRLVAERLALLLPAFLVERLFRATTLERPAAVAGGRSEVKSSFVLAGGNGVASLLSLAYMTYVGRSLGPAGSADYYGSVFLVFLLITLATPLSVLITREASAASARMDFGRVAHTHWAGLRWGMILGLGAAALFALLLVPVMRLMNFASVAAPALSFVIAFSYVQLTTTRGIMRAGQKYGAHSLSMILEAGLRLAVGVALFLSFRSVVVALSAYVIATVSAHGVALLHTEVRRTSADPLGGLVRGLFPLLVIASADAVLQNFDVFFVKAAFSDANAGVYGAVASVTRVLGVAATPVAVLALPHFTQQVALGKSPARSLVRLCLIFMGFAGIPLLAMAIWPGPLMTLLFGRGFGAGGKILLLHGISLLPTYLAMFVAQAFVASGKWRVAWLYGAGALLYVAAIMMAPDTLPSVLWVLIAFKSFVFLVMVVAWVVAARADRR